MCSRCACAHALLLLLLPQVGAFYEAAGLDALLLVEHAGLNLMGSNLEVPRAGCPEANLLGLLRVLVEERGLSVVRGRLHWHHSYRFLDDVMWRCGCRPWSQTLHASCL